MIVNFVETRLQHHQQQKEEGGDIHYFLSKGESIDKNLYSHSGFGGYVL